VKSKPPADQKAQAQVRAKRAALNALRRAKRIVEKTGAELSAWEGEFLGSVEERVEKFGRAFGDPDKGGPGQALSTLQGVKLKEIAAKAQGRDKAKPRKPLKPRKPGW
jgi:hypothetical protein